MSRHLVMSSSLALLLIGLVAAEVPSYIQVCGRKNPEINKCVQESVDKLRPKLKNGLPELDVPSLEPLTVEEIALANLADFRAIATNVKLWGLTNFTINYLKVDLPNQRIDLELVFSSIKMESDYDVKAKILVPISEKGPISTTTDEVVAKVSIKFQTVNRRGMKLMYFPSMTTKLTISDYTANFMPGAKSNPVTQAINSVLANSRQEIIVSMTPSLERAISEKVLDISNRICKHFTYDELFPDHE